MKDLDQAIQDYMQSSDFKDRLKKDLDFTPPITIADAIERLVIMHVKLWGIEDAIRVDGVPLTVVGDLRKKISHLNAVVRPRMVEGLGDMLAKAVRDGNEDLVREPNLKNYNEGRE